MIRSKKMSWLAFGIAALAGAMAGLAQAASPASADAAGVRMLPPTPAQQCHVETAGLGHGAKDLAAVMLPWEEIARVRVGRAP